MLQSPKRRYSTLRLFAMATTAAVCAAVLPNSASAHGGCTLSGPVSVWAHKGDGQWNVAADWNGGVPHSKKTSACITNGVSTVTMNKSSTVNDLQLGAGNTLDVGNPNSNMRFSVFGSEILNAGIINLTAGIHNTVLAVENNLALGGKGTIRLGTTGKGKAGILGLGLGYSLTNVNNLIEGTGLVAGLKEFVNHGIVDANVFGKTLTVSVGKLVNTGLLEATNAGGLLLNSAFTNGGQMQTATASETTVKGAFSNSTRGHVTVAQGGKFLAVDGYRNSGVTEIDGNLRSTAVTNTATGSIGGSGNIVANLFNYGTVTPGSPSGHLTVDGNYTQETGSTLDIGVGGTGAGQYGQLDVTKAADLTGTLAVSLLNGFALVNGDKFEVLKSGSITGNFDALSFNNVACQYGGAGIWGCSNLGGGLFLTESFRGSQVWLTVTGPSGQGGGNVPEPTSIVVFATGLLAALGLVRRRKQNV